MNSETVRYHEKEACKYLKENGFRDVIIIGTIDKEGKDAACMAKCEPGGQGLKLAAWFMNQCMINMVEENCGTYKLWRSFLRALVQGIREEEKKEIEGKGR